MDFSKEWDQFQDIPHLNLPLPPYTKREYPITGKPMDFTSEAEDEVIREVVSQKLDRPLVNPSICFGWNQIKLKLQLHPSILVTI